MKGRLAQLYRWIPIPIVKRALRLAHTKFSVTAVGVFFDYQGHVLILRHVYRHHHPWGLPAGFIDAGETPEAGILRELEEETAMVAHITRVLAVTSLTPRHLEVALLGSIDSAQTPSFNHEIFESSFVDPKNLPDGLPSGQKALIESASHSLNPASA